MAGQVPSSEFYVAKTVAEKVCDTHGQWTHLRTCTRNVLLPQRAPGGVAGWKPSGKTSVVWGQCQTAGPARGRAGSSGKALSTPQVTSLKINKAQVPPCPIRELDQESFLKVSCGSFNYEEDRILSHLPFIRYSLSLFGLQATFPLRDLETTPCYLCF